MSCIESNHRLRKNLRRPSGNLEFFPEQKSFRDRDRHKLWWVRPLYPSFPAWPVPMRRRTVGIVYTRAGGPTRRSATQRCGGVGSGRDMTTLFTKKRLPLLSNAGVAALSTQAESAADSSWSRQAATGIRHSVSTSNSERCARRGS